MKRILIHSTDTERKCLSIATVVVLLSPMATAQRSLRVRTRAGGEPSAADQLDISDVNNGGVSEDDERSKGKKTTAKAAGAVAASSSMPSSATSKSSSTWRRGRALVWVAYLVSWAFYAYIRATRSLDLGAYSW